MMKWKSPYILTTVCYQLLPNEFYFHCCLIINELPNQVVIIINKATINI